MPRHGGHMRKHQGQRESVIFVGRNEHEAGWADSGLSRLSNFSGSGHKGQPWSSGTWPWVRRAGE